MAEIKGNKFTAAEADATDVKVRAYGDTVIRTSRTRNQTGVSHFMEVWVKQGGQWKAAHTQFSQAAK